MFDDKFKEFEAKWSERWLHEGAFRVKADASRPKYYCLDMFPYPSGAGLHVGHPRGYIATDIFSRYKTMSGFNVLHPMGFDSFGLPAEQFAIETGQHPSVTTAQNIAKFKGQLTRLGLCVDVDREIVTSDPNYYRWTQWIFLRLFNSWFDTRLKRARPISELVEILTQHGATGLQAACSEDFTKIDPVTWRRYSSAEQETFLMNFRMAFKAEADVNWCPALGTVLANDEAINGLSERGGHPVVRKRMNQWFLRVTAYADRLLDGLADLDWPESVKTIQKNWIGKIDGLFIESAYASPTTEAPLGRTRSSTYKLRDATFGRQRYWGEPIPVYYDSEGIARPVNEEDLPLLLPDVSTFTPTSAADAPLARLADWRYEGYQLETTTMPGWAASSWYFLRYTDPHNGQRFAGAEQTSYWNSVDLYVGGVEHATGHLIYARFFTNFLYDLGEIDFSEPFTRLICQGMILGVSAVIYRDIISGNFISADLVGERGVQPVHIDVQMVSEDNTVDITKLRQWRTHFSTSEFELSDAKFFCARITEKMSKSKHNVVNPDDIIDQYGTDCFRLHQMFLGPIDHMITWSTETIEGPHRFLARLWRLFYDSSGKLIVSQEPPSASAAALVDDLIMIVRQRTEAFAFNAAIAAMMSCVNQLTRTGIHNSEVLKKLVLVLHPYAPFVTSELWEGALGQKTSLLSCSYPEVIFRRADSKVVSMQIATDGKTRFLIDVPEAVARDKVALEEIVRSDEKFVKWLSSPVSKIVFVPEKVLNFIIARD
ncbi:class I tRNA ligase family protein [Pseudomonas sp. R1-18]|uniref:class I tRNA ligase family protein n=1 Tax=Pseudomonas sp. R1-18 TaxID=1632772 RepID=UPI003DAA1EB5